MVPDPQKIQEDILKIHSHLKPHVANVIEGSRHILPSLPPPLQPRQPHINGSQKILIPDHQKVIEDVEEICGSLKPHVSDVIEEDKPIPSSSLTLPPPLPPFLPHTNKSSKILIPDHQTVTEDVKEIQGFLKPHVPDVVEEEKLIPSSSPTLPPPLPPSPPHTNTGSKILIPDHQTITEDVIEIHGFLKPHVPDVVEKEKPILSSSPSPPQPPPPPHTNGRRFTILIPDLHVLAEDVTDIHEFLKLTDVVEDDRPISSSSVTPPPPVPLPPSPQHTTRCSTILIPDHQKVAEDVKEICGCLEPHVPDVVEEDKPIPSSSPFSPPLPLPTSLPHTNRSSKTISPDHQKIPEDVKEIHGSLKPHAPNVTEKDKPIPSSLPSPPQHPPPPHKNGRLTILIPNLHRISDVTEIHGHLQPFVTDDIEDDRPIPLSPPPSLPLPLPPPYTNGSLRNLVPDPQNIPGYNTVIHGHLNPHVLDVVEEDRPIWHSPPFSPSPLPRLQSRPDTNGSLIPDPHKIQKDVTEIYVRLNPHVSDVIKDKGSVLPDTNESLSILFPDPHKVSEDIIEIDNGQKPDVLDVVEEDRPIPPFLPWSLPLPHTNGSLKILTPNMQKISEDVKKVHGRLRPHVSDVVEDDILIQSSPPLIKNKEGWIIYLQSTMALSVILLLLLAILALCWLSIYWVKRTKSKNAVANIEDQDSTKKPEDVTGAVNNEGVASQNDDRSTTDHKTIGSATETVTSPAMISAHVISPHMPSAKLPEILWQHVIVPDENVLQTELDILKSIVYGGLVESITSFGIVSSAAASGTSTSNVLALGLANLFSGLFLMIYNLYGLVMSEQLYQSANIDHMTAVKATDPYEELLGNRKKVILHCVVVVLSFIVFGVIPPLFYGLSFKITDNGHYEAAVVVAASLVCVISLSFAKAYAFGMDKLNTVAVYTGIAIGASALSFIASQHVRVLFEKYDFHKLASA